MKTEITSDIRNHRANENYKCLRVWFDVYDDAVDLHYNHMGNVEEIDWMPRFSELEEIIRKLCDMDPEFEDRILRVIRDVERDIPVLEVDT